MSDPRQDEYEDSEAARYDAEKAQYDAEVDTRMRLIAHDAALRAEVERLKIKIKNYEPVDTYNGCSIEEWKAEAERLSREAQMWDREATKEKARADAAEREVERLARIQLPLVCNGVCCPHCVASHRTALDIEVELRAMAEGTVKDYLQVRSERDRLAAALREIAGIGYCEGNGPLAISIATTALAGEKP